VTRIVEADEQGAVHLDREMLGSRPGTKYTVDLSADQVVLKPVPSAGTSEKPLWERLTPQQRAADFLNLVREWRKLPGGPSLSNEALRRENMYD
jgi:hypothetical protein